MLTLTNTTWYIPAGWQAPSGYGYYFINCIINDTSASMLQIGYTAKVDSFDKLFLIKKDSSIAYADIDSISHNISNNEAFTITFESGSDLQDETLISWLETYGQQLITKAFRLTPAHETDYVEIIYDAAIIATLNLGDEVVLHCAGTTAKTPITIKNYLVEVEEEVSEEPETQ